MYLEIDNEAPIQIIGDEVVPIGRGPVKTVLQFPDGTGVMKAIATAKEAIQYHVADGKVSGFHSDDTDLEYFLNKYYGVKQRPGAKTGVLSGLATATLLMLVFAMTRSQLRYTYGSSWLAGVMGNPASNGTGAFAPGVYLGISQNSTAPVNTDTSLVGEMSPLSTPVASTTLARTLATYGYTPGATTYTESNVFVSDCTVTIYKSALFIGPTGGQPIFGSLLKIGGVTASQLLNSGDEVGVSEVVDFT